MSDFRAKLPATLAGLCFVGAAACSSIALAQSELPSQPLIRVETGVHTAAIKGFAANTDCTLVVTGSDDKTARIWSVAPGGGEPVLLRTLRPPIGYGDLGKIYAVALSPDGKLVAVSGWTRPSQHYVMLFDAERGTMLAELGPLQNVVNRLAFSPTGRHLAASLGVGHGVVAWERQGLAEWRQVLNDPDFNKRDSYGLAFGPDGRLFAVGDDGTLRSYDRNFKRQGKVSTPGGKEPYSVAVHPGGKIVAVGHDDTHAVELYDADTLKLIHTAANPPDAKGNISSVAWSRDGKRLWAAGTYKKDDIRQFRAWDEQGRGVGETIASKAENTIRELGQCGDGIGYAASDPGFGIIDPTGAGRAWVGAVQVDMRGKQGDYFTASANGLQVRFGLNYGGEKPAVLDLSVRTLLDSTDRVASFLTPRVTGIDVTDWKDSRNPLLRGQPIKLKQYEDSRSLAIAVDAKHFVLGTSWYLRAFDAQGKQLWEKATTGSAWGVNLVAKDRLLIAALGDGTLRWLRMSDGRELLAAFIHAKDRRWIAWTPKGYYTSSDKGDDLIGWHQNRGWGRVAEFAFAHERRDQFRRPDIVKAAIEMLDEDRAIAAAKAR